MEVAWRSSPLASAGIIGKGRPQCGLRGAKEDVAAGGKIRLATAAPTMLLRRVSWFPVRVHAGSFRVMGTSVKGFGMITF